MGKRGWMWMWVDGYISGSGARLRFMGGVRWMMDEQQVEVE